MPEHNDALISRPADTGKETPPRVPHPAGRTPTDAEVRDGRVWAVWSAAHATTPQSHAAARYTLSRIPGGVLVRWDGARWVAPADTGKETDQ